MGRAGGGSSEGDTRGGWQDRGKKWPSTAASALHGESALAWHEGGRGVEHEEQEVGVTQPVAPPEVVWLNQLGSEEAIHATSTGVENDKTRHEMTCLWSHLSDVGPVQAVHAVGADDARLRADHLAALRALKVAEGDGTTTTNRIEPR